VSKEESIETGFVPTLAVMMHYIHLIDSHNIISKRSRLQLGITHHPKNQKFSKVKEKKKKKTINRYEHLDDKDTRERF